MAQKFCYSFSCRKQFFSLLFALTVCFVSFSQTTVFQSTDIPQVPLNNDGLPIELGFKFRSTQSGYITGLRFYKGAGNSGTHIGHLWSSTGVKLAEAMFTNETNSGWQEVTISPVAITTGTTYIASYFSSAGYYANSNQFFTSAVVNGPLRALANGEDGTNGVYIYTTASAFPTDSYQSSNYWVDVVFNTIAGPDVTPPTVLTVSPVNASTGVSIASAVSAVFNEAMNATTLSSSTFELRNASNILVASTVSYNASTNTVTLTPSAALSNSTLYTATIIGGAGGVKDAAGNALATNYTWTFTTAAPDITPPTISSVSPVNGATAVSVNTTVSAIFSEAMNATTISGSTFELRNASNAVVASAISYNTSNRTATLTPSAALANSTLYTATVIGGASGVKDAAGNALATNYTWTFTTVAADIIPPTISSVSPVNGATDVTVSTTVSAIFSEAMNATTISNSTFELRNASNVVVTSVISYNTTTRTATLTPSAALANSTLYTATVIGGAPGVKDAAGNALATNYTWTFTTVAADITAPTISSVSPVNGATGVTVSTAISATFSEAMNAGTINSSTFELRNASNVVVASVISYNTSTRTATLTPSAILTDLSLYTATVKGGGTGVKDAAGNALATNYTWTFTTATVLTSTFTIFQTTDIPSSPINNDGTAIEVGFKFRSTQNGNIKGVRYYKGAGVTGTRIGHLWSSTGIMLGEAAFTGESASGWQQVLFTTPVAITANTTYIASYFSSSGHYAVTNPYFTSAVVNGSLRALANGEDGANGVYIYTEASAFPVDNYQSSNYWADVVFTPTTSTDLTPPTILSVTPSNGTANVSTSAEVTATFSEAMNATTISNSTFELRNASNVLITATVSYNASTNKVTLTPSAPLINSTVYTATVKGGASGVKDVAGNALANNYSWTFTTTAEPQFIAPTEGPGGPILVISTSANPFSLYAVEILRAEGFNEFGTSDISAVTAAVLNNYDVVILGEMTVTLAQVTMLTNWVNAGGTLIVFKPSSSLTSLLGISGASGTLTNGYLLVNTTSGPGVGIVNQTIQFHGTANRHSLRGATRLATLYSSATTATSNPAVTTRNVGANGGRAIAFTYDLAKSIVYTRQGNPAWAGTKRDGQSGPIRSDDLFFGGTSPNWIDFNKVAIPQADEQQRLLANIILQGNLHRKPLPRFWYLPRDLKAAIVMTGDDHASNGTPGRFNQYLTLGPNSAQDVADWKAVRGTSYVYTSIAMTDAQAASFEAQGFEIALHPNTGCVNYTLTSLQNTFTTQLAQFASKFPSLSAPVSNRTHCLVWSDWSSTPKVELQKGIRLDANYYYWPASWVQNRPGMFTGSGMPMRFADTDGSLIDNYQLPTQMTDESGIGVATHTNALLDKALGAEGYYGVFNANMHTDTANHTGSNAIIASAQARQVPVISAKQMLTWLDGRNNSFFSNMTWSNNQLSFKIFARSGAKNLKAMLPIYAETGQLNSITMNGNVISYTTQTIKGLQYAFFAAAAGTNSYVASYNSPLPRIAGTGVTAQTALETAIKEIPDESLNVKLEVEVRPNPSSNYFDIVINSKAAGPVTVRVLDIFGKVSEKYEKVATGSIRIGQSLTGGIYFAEVIQGNQRQVIKIIKLN